MIINKWSLNGTSVCCLRTISGIGQELDQKKKSLIALYGDRGPGSKHVLLRFPSKDTLLLVVGVERNREDILGQINDHTSLEWTCYDKFSHGDDITNLRPGGQNNILNHLQETTSFQKPLFF